MSAKKQNPEPVTPILRRWSDGELGALDELIPQVEQELKKIARRLLRGERHAQTLGETTGLVNEMYAALLRQQSTHWESRAHFLGIAAHLMRQILVGYARKRGARKRGASWVQSSSIEASAFPAVERDLELVDLIALHDALDRLAALDQRQARIVELRFFGGLTTEETAEVLGISIRTVKRDWRFARLWLRRELLSGEHTS